MSEDLRLGKARAQPTLAFPNAIPAAKLAPIHSAGDTRGPGEKARRVVLRTVAALRGWNRSVLVDGTVVALLFLQMQCAEFA